MSSGRQLRPRAGGVGEDVEQRHRLVPADAAVGDALAVGRRPARDEILILCSCKMAVKAGDKLGHAEMERLVQDLALTENPYLCPHGRPITVVMPKSDLMRRFKR